MKVMIDDVRYVPEPIKITDKSLFAALEVYIDSDVGDTTTIRDYFRKLLMTLWEEREGFSGKRPFGDSCWEYEIYSPLVKAGFIDGEIDEDGWATVKDERVAHAYVGSLIVAMCHGIDK